MAKELNNDEPFPDGIRRIAGEMVDAMINFVRHENNTEEAIHNFRKGCKEIRALLRLVRDALGETAYQIENTFYRDLARPFSERRDRWVFIETIDEVLIPGNTADTELFQTTRSNLLADYMTRYGEIRPESFGEVAAKLAEARNRIGDWPAVNVGFAAVGKGLHRVYQDGRSSMATAIEEPDPETRHKWRKLVKYLWYQLGVLRPIAPEEMEGTALDWYRLSSLLGVDHDLTELFKALSSDPALAGGPENLHAIKRVIDTHLEELATQNRILGEKLYRDDADAFVQRFSGYWSIARG